jgi:hypothetical protein
VALRSKLADTPQNFDCDGTVRMQVRSNQRLDHSCSEHRRRIITGTGSWSRKSGDVTLTLSDVTFKRSGDRRVVPKAARGFVYLV